MDVFTFVSVHFLITNNVVVGATLVIKKTTRIGDSKMHDVHFGSRFMTVVDNNVWFDRIKTGDCAKIIYGIIEIHKLSEEALENILTIAPPPPPIMPFLLPERVTIFFTIVPSDECVVVPCHIDEHGSGPLIYGSSIIGACTTFALCPPDYSKKKTTPPALKNIFTNTNKLTNKSIHMVNMSVRGTVVNIPSGYWHTVRTHGSSIRVSYYFQQRDI